MRFISRYTFVLFIPLLVWGFASCKEEPLGDVEAISGLGGDVVVPTAIDNWLMDSITVPYNIAFKYRWDQFEFNDVSKTLVPPDEQKIIPLAKVVRSAWIKPYIDQVGLVFFNKYSPKFFVLSGSVQYLSNGAVVLGQAEGGRKIVVFDVNNFITKQEAGYVPARDSAVVKEFVHTLQHEFAHILHQNILYPVEFKTVTAGLFQGENWINVSNTEARQDGFITAYASSGFDDDFVETVSIMLIEGKAGWEAILNAIPEGVSANGTSKADAVAKLRRKEALVVSYFKTAWGIDFYELQARSRAALQPLL
ncbi:substrate import-associated zinc metallohydrolase lipoprotein [Dyadobacter jejuensis]|uniref:Substrate import-associated zinc metallohydrolase lipoprotein n=1 Tax=Dyadobacter jejuensis TaxID=1082580 RepID=A0A316BDN8_9BACT|nr:putative zinc-binding metallopeptidase [Dyadobacter jejuensis]PWJ60617.1 substrate import-associated zinc metallohydrolase lipoprotein [Dyadobacter jejuensis]